MKVKNSFKKFAMLAMMSAAFSGGENIDFANTLSSKAKKFKKRPNTPKGIAKKKKAKRRIVAKSRAQNRKK